MYFAADTDPQRVLDAWIITHDGPRCPGAPTQEWHPANKPHLVQADGSGLGGLLVRWRDVPGHVSDGWHLVACTRHLGAWMRYDYPQPRPDPARQVRSYRVRRPYSAVIGTPDALARDVATRNLAVDAHGRVRWSEGDIMRLPGWVPAQVARDAGPDVLQLLGPDGEPAQTAPSCEDIEAGSPNDLESSTENVMETTGENTASKPRKGTLRRLVGAGKEAE